MNFFGMTNSKNSKNTMKNNSKNVKSSNNATRKNNVAPLPQMGGKMMTVGSRRCVWNGTAKHTSGGLERKDLMLHKGRIVSRKAHAAGKKAIKHLIKAGFKAKKGTFKLFSKRR